MSLLQKQRLDMGGDERVRYDHELTDFIYKHKIHYLKDMLYIIVILIVVLIGISIATGFADSADYQTATGFMGSWIGIVSLALVSVSGVIVWAQVAKSKSQFKDFSLMELCKSYKAVLGEYIKDSQFQIYSIDHPADSDCIGRAIIHSKLASSTSSP